MSSAMNGTAVVQSGFGDTLTTPERKSYASFIPFCREPGTIQLNTSSFTPYLQESPCNVFSKIDIDTMAVNSDEVNVSARQQESIFEVNSF